MSDKPLTDNQRRWLWDIYNGVNPADRLRGRSAFGGATRVAFSLQRRGLLDRDEKITEEGLLVVGKMEKAR